MKKKKIINVRKSLVAGALAFSALLAGLGIYNYNTNKNQSPVETTTPEPSTSQNIIDEEHNHNHELPGGIIIDPVSPEVTDPIIEEPIETITPENNQGSQEQKPGAGTNENNQNTGGNNNQNNIETPTTTEPPIEPTDPIVIEEQHTHTLGDWVSINDYFEGSYCPDDGKLMRVRLHSYNVLNSTSISNNNGTHNSTIELICDTCGHTATVTRNNIKCEDTVLIWDENYEYEVCNDCGYKATIGTHKLDNGTIRGNEIIYACENEGCGYTRTKAYNPTTPVNPSNPGHGGGSITNPHIHTFGPWVSINDNLEESRCPEDGKLMGTRPHSYSEPNTKSISNGDGTHNVVTSTVCDTCGHAKTTTVENVACTFDNGVINSDQTKITYTCTECGYTKTENYTPEHNHNWSAWQVTKAPTCTETGIETRTCTVEGCTIKTETRTIPALGHTYGEWVVSEDWHVVTKTDGTQVEQRTLEQTCSVCGDKNTKTEERPYTPEHNHNWSEWKVTKQPTCTEDGEETRTCTVEGCTIKTETRTIPALGHTYNASTNLVSNSNGTHDIVKTETCLTCGDVITETVSSGVSCTYNNIEEVKNENGEVIQEIHSCDCGHSYTVDIDPKPEHTTHTPDSNGQQKRKPGDCCYETYYICEVCGEEYGNNKVGHREGEPDEAGVIQCTECGKVLRVVETEDEDIVVSRPSVAQQNNPEDAIDQIISEQDQAKIDASINADQKLDELLNSDASDAEMDAALEEIIAEQEQAISDANTAADQQLDEAITAIENARVDEIIAEQDQAIEEARRTAEAELEEIVSSDADAETKDAAIDKVIEETDRAIGEATAQADAELAALLGIIPATPAVRVLIK